MINLKKNYAKKNGIKILYFTDKCLYEKHHNDNIFYDFDLLKEKNI